MEATIWARHVTAARVEHSGSTWWVHVDVGGVKSLTVFCRDEREARQVCYAFEGMALRADA